MSKTTDTIAALLRSADYLDPHCKRHMLDAEDGILAATALRDHAAQLQQVSELIFGRKKESAR